MAEDSRSLSNSGGLSREQIVNYVEKFHKPLIILDNVTLRVDRTLLFKHTSWEIRSNQHWAIIGPNGSGKSTLANAVFRKVAVVHGRILYFFDNGSGNVNHARSYFYRGEILRISPEDHKELLQSQGGYHQARWQSIEGADAITVSDLLTGESIEHTSPYEVSPLKVSDEVYRARRRKAIDLLGIEHLLERKILHVSHGEARKVLIARTLMQSPKLLILDDPFCGLDNFSREIVKNTLDGLLIAGSPQILLVAPRIEEIPQGITHVLCVDDNQVVDQGRKDTILHSEFARELFASQSNTGDLRSRLKKIPPNPPLRKGGKKHVPPFSKGGLGGILIEMKDTSVSYGAVDVLRDINWIMRQGENWAILGPNGAGKTTLLSLILADNPQSYANEIRLFGRRRGSGESIWDIKRNIGWVSPELQFYYHSESMCYNVVCSGFFDSVGLYRECSPEQTSVAEQWMRSFGIEDLADRSLGNVSAGEQRLVLLARALVKNPILLILDEPCQGLDFSHRKRIIDLLDQLSPSDHCLPRRGRGEYVNMIYVTHHFNEMPNAITHVLKLDQGLIQKCGLRENVLNW
jgi:molybdate transport system ATP-binding protein